MRALKAFALCLIAILGIASSTPGASASEIQSTILYVKPGAAGDCSGWQ